MAVYVVRHGCAGDKTTWDGPDDERPLDEGGKAQASAVAAVLGELPIVRVISSPARRCVDTVAPLAARRGVEVERSAALAKSANGDLVLEILTSITPHDVVICTHGEVLRAAIPRLQAEGIDIVGAAGGFERALAKGSAWCVEFDGERPAHATFLALAGTSS